jgi:hypothetical protein
VLSLFEKAVAGEFDMFDDDIRKVKFPVLPTSVLHPSQVNFERIKVDPVQEIEQLFLDDNLPIHMVVDLLHILASLTRVGMGERPIGKKLSYKHVLPSNIIGMAENACVHTGECLCKHGLCHALDAGGPDILSAKLTLAKHKSNVCMIIAHKVLASMKMILYAATSAITATEFLAAECNCKAGCKNQSSSDLGQHRIICTHSITVPVQLSLLMFRGMAELVPVYFHRHMRRENVDDLDEHHQRQVRNDILLLIKATGMRPPLLDANATILDLLMNYAETTGRAKISPGEANPRCTIRGTTSKCD